MNNSEVLEATITSYPGCESANQFICVDSKTITAAGSSDRFLTQEDLEAILKNMSSIPLVQHKCQNCGASLTFENTKHIFICKYCGTTYFVGTNMINDPGE